MVGKGIVSSIIDRRASVVPYDAKSAVTPPLIIPDELKEELRPGAPVVYMFFEDNTGAVIGIMDES